MLSVKCLADGALLRHFTLDISIKRGKKFCIQRSEDRVAASQKLT